MSPLERLVAFILELLGQAPPWALGPAFFVLLTLLSVKLEHAR